MICRKNLSTALLALTAVTAVACVTDDVTKTRETTQEMSGITQGMAKTTDKMNENVEGTHKTASHTYVDLRQKDGVEARANALERMEKAPNVTSKGEEAGVYMMAFEFQLWKGDEVDTEAHRQALYKDALIEFLKQMKRYTKGDSDKRNPSPRSKKKDKENLYALASALHKINPNAEALNQEKKLKPVSMLDLLESGLAAKADIESGRLKKGEFPPYISEVLREEADVVYLLQLRVNILSAMAMARMSNIDDEGLFGLMGLFHGGMDYLKKWDSEVPRMSVEQIRYETLIMQYANATADFLKSVGLSARMDKMMMKIVKNAQIEYEIPPAASDVSVAAQTIRTRNAAIAELKNELEKFTSSN